MSARALIFHMNIPCDKTFFRGYHFCYLVTLTLEFDTFFENFDLAYNFWTLSARALIFHISDPSDKDFLRVLYDFRPCDIGLWVRPIFWKL